MLTNFRKRNCLACVHASVCKYKSLYESVEKDLIDVMDLDEIEQFGSDIFPMLECRNFFAIEDSYRFILDRFLSKLLIDEKELIKLVKGVKV